ncbi:MAG: hypothetical protein CFH15_01309 [Alphaproteobacteria bacterium MarineAlpha5_Bin5]|nr:MAG: hypothetical protein CFH15_01309 [Alphaproteobacteria bacterium MarineAlpha5_Bin5]|tara:strand:- start:4089 stop:4472 length:384 start_codon:yes stop_codon:yes gene_type:complete
MIKNKELNDFLPDNKASYFKEFQNFSKEQINKDEIIKCIKTVLDPEIPVNIYDLGLIYNIDIKNNDVIINMTLTNPNCPVAGSMPKNVGKSVEKINSLNSIRVNLVWEPKWHKDLMSEDAKLALDIF